MPNKPNDEDEELGAGMGPATPGGVYEDAPGSGTFHDAHGRAVNEDGKLLAGDDVPGAVNAEQDEAWRADMEKQRKASAAASAPKGGKSAPASDLDALSVDELAELAEERGVEVEGTGANGRVLKADYVRALGG